MALIRTIFDSEREKSAFSKLNSLVFQQAGSLAEMISLIWPSVFLLMLPKTRLFGFC
jgi:hypothetical protein